MTNFYRVDGGKLTFAEYWRMSPDPFSFLIAAGLKLVGLPIRFTFAIPRPDRLFLVAFDELPASARFGMGPFIDAAEDAGLELAFCHRLAVPEPDRLGAAAVLLDKPQATALGVMFGQQGDRREVHMTCNTPFADDTCAVTTTMKKSMVPVPGSRIERYPGVDPALLYQYHQRHLERLADDGLVPLHLDPVKLPQTVLSWELRYVDFHISRGVFVEMTDDEVDAVCGRKG